MEYLQGENVKKNMYHTDIYNISIMDIMSLHSFNCCNFNQFIPFLFTSSSSFSFFILLFILRKTSAFNKLPWIWAIFMVLISRFSPWIWYSMDLHIKQRMRICITLIVLVFPVCYRSITQLHKYYRYLLVQLK